MANEIDVVKLLDASAHSGKVSDELISMLKKLQAANEARLKNNGGVTNLTEQERVYKTQEMIKKNLPLLENLSNTSDKNVKQLTETLNSIRDFFSTNKSGHK